MKYFSHQAIPIERVPIEIKSRFEKNFVDRGLSVSFGRCQVLYPGQVFKSSPASKETKSRKRDTFLRAFLPFLSSNVVSRKQILKMAIELLVDPPA